MTSSHSTPSISNPTPPVLIEDPPDLLGLDEPSVPLPSASSNSIKASSTDNIDPLHEIFTIASTNINESNIIMTNLDQDLQSAFLPPSNDINTTSTNTNNVMSNDRILALFNTPQTSTANVTGINIRPTLNINSPNFVHPQIQQHHLLSQKSASFGNNLYQQSTNQFIPNPGLQPQQNYLYAPRPAMTTMNHNNSNNISAPALQTPLSNQLNNQFSQFVPFANSKTNTSASALISNMPTRPVTEYMPASSDLLW